MLVIQVFVITEPDSPRRKDAKTRSNRGVVIVDRARHERSVSTQFAPRDERCNMDAAGYTGHKLLLRIVLGVRS